MIIFFWDVLLSSELVDNCYSELNQGDELDDYQKKENLTIRIINLIILCIIQAIFIISILCLLKFLLRFILKKYDKKIVNGFFVFNIIILFLYYFIFINSFFIYKEIDQILLGK